MKEGKKERKKGWKRERRNMEGEKMRMGEGR